MPADAPRLDRQPDFQLEIRVDVPRVALHAFLLELENLAPLHPLIESIERLEAVPSRPGARRYRVVDRIPLGPFRMRTVYVAELEAISECEVQGTAWQKPGVRLNTIYRLSEVREEGGIGTRLEERAFVEAPFLLRRFVIRQAKAAHAGTLAGIKSLLETAKTERS